MSSIHPGNTIQVVQSVGYGGETAPMFVVAAPPAQVMLDRNRLRDTLIPPSGHPGYLLHVAYAHENLSNKICCESILGRVWTCGCSSLVQQTIKRSTYAAVYDSRLEWNEPSSVCVPYAQSGCFNAFNVACLQTDAINVVHYDRAIVANAVKAENCCRPCCVPNACLCTHFELFPDCCGWYGESIVIFATEPPCECCKCSPCFQCCQCKIVDQYTALHGSPMDIYTAQFGAGCWAPPHRLIRGVDNAQALVQAINTARLSSKTPNVILGKAPEPHRMQ